MVNAKRNHISHQIIILRASDCNASDNYVAHLKFKGLSPRSFDKLEIMIGNLRCGSVPKTIVS